MVLTTSVKNANLDQANRLLVDNLLNINMFGKFRHMNRLGQLPMDSAGQQRLDWIYWIKWPRISSLKMVEKKSSQHPLDQTWPGFLDELYTNPRKAADGFANFAYRLLTVRPPSILWNCSADLRKDLIQEVILHCIADDYSVLKTYRDDGKPFRSFLVKVAFRRIIDELRKQQRISSKEVSFTPSQHQVDLIDIILNRTPGPDERYEHAEALAIVEECLGLIKEKGQKLIGYARQGYSHKEIAVLMGYGPQGNANVSDDLRYWRKRLIDLAKDKGLDLSVFE